MEFRKVNMLKIVCQVFKIIGIVSIVQSTIIIAVLGFFIPSIKEDLGGEGTIFTLVPFSMFASGWMFTIVFFVGIYRLGWLLMPIYSRQRIISPVGIMESNLCKRIFIREA